MCISGFASTNSVAKEASGFGNHYCCVRMPNEPEKLNCPLIDKADVQDLDSFLVMDNKGVDIWPLFSKPIVWINRERIVSKLSNNFPIATKEPSAYRQFAINLIQG
jgi:hypothetical protein